jgi:photosystem II stability/assembly factor-like uncharacterized protein
VFVTAALAATAAATVGGLYLTQDGGAGDRVVSGGALAPLEYEPGVVHVHGLGVDPGDGVLYAATHSGLFRIPAAGEAARVANRAQDTMGFSVVGPGSFIGSGHPDPREDDVRPPLLGLIESDDRGQTWDRISLHGEADFHALHAAHGRVYGYDSTSQTFMVSEDREAWDRRSQLAMADFAVDPADAETVLATTERGLVRSDDGGRSWTAVDGAPTMVVLAWAEPGQLYGVTPDGTVQRSEDGGTSWQARGSAGGQPEAITVDVRGGEERLYVAAADRGILVSADQGRTFTTRYSA